MEPEFWHTRWRESRIGFHEPQPHALLRRHWPGLGLPANSPVLVPLCGKSLDMLWLHEQGHPIVGSELSPVAVADFFAEHDLPATTRALPGQVLHEAGALRIFCGDFFALDRATLGPVVAAFDRAALVALPADMRSRYAGHLLDLLPAAARVLLITLDYDADLFDGPPFAVSEAEIARLFGARCRIRRLEQASSLVKGRFEVQETATRLTVLA